MCPDLFILLMCLSHVMRLLPGGNTYLELLLTDVTHGWHLVSDGRLPIQAQN